MSSIISASNLYKNYGNHIALNNISFDIKPGKIVGLIGPNGAGKTTLLKSILGLAAQKGTLSVLGMNPATQRTKLLEQVSFIADTATLPRWLKVSQAIEYVEGVHPRFNKEKANIFLKRTNIKNDSKIGSLSKGMVTQLHLALIMAIDSKLLVLDEPTLGLDIVFRKQFYNTLLNDYFDEQKTILITTHQVEEIENILTDLIFINKGAIALNTSMEDIETQFTELHINNNDLEALNSTNLKPISKQSGLSGTNLIFENVDRDQLAQYGKVKTPSVSDLFVAKMTSSSEEV